MTKMNTDFKWSGRDDPEDGETAKRWHHIIQDGTKGQGKDGSKDNNDLTLLGFACDIGIARNKGRTGAAQAPNTLRKNLANLAWHGAGRLSDAGNIGMAAGDNALTDDVLHQAQTDLGNRTAQLLNNGSKVLILGGGHETAAGSFYGLHQHCKNTNIGIINLDAHFDIRLVGDNGISSGTPFTQIRDLLTAGNQSFHYMALGITQTGNTRALFDRATDWGVDYMLDTQMTAANMPNILRMIDRFLKKIDVLYLPLDLDVLPHWQMPAVSAPSGRGVDMHIIETIITHIGKTAQAWPLSDVVEFNPSLDNDGRAARTAACLIDTLARAMLG